MANREQKTRASFNCTPFPSLACGSIPVGTDGQAAPGQAPSMFLALCPDFFCSVCNVVFKPRSGVRCCGKYDACLIVAFSACARRLVGVQGSGFPSHNDHAQNLPPAFVPPPFCPPFRDVTGTGMVHGACAVDVEFCFLFVGGRHLLSRVPPSKRSRRLLFSSHGKVGPPLLLIIGRPLERAAPNSCQ